MSMKFTRLFDMVYHRQSIYILKSNAATIPSAHQAVPLLSNFCQPWHKFELLQMHWNVMLWCKAVQPWSGTKNHAHGGIEKQWLFPEALGWPWENREVPWEWISRQNMAAGKKDIGFVKPLSCSCPLGCTVTNVRSFPWCNISCPRGFIGVKKLIEGSNSGFWSLYRDCNTCSSPKVIFWPM